MKKTVLIPIVALPIIAVLVLASTYLIPVHDSILSKITWKSMPQLISINDMEREGHKGLLLKRLKDGKEQFIAGNWKTSYTSQGNVLIVGEFPEGYSSTTGQHLFMVKNDKIMSVKLDNVTGTVVSVEESPNQAYLYFVTKDGEKNGSCMMDWIKAGQPDCLPIKVADITKARWESGQGHELVVQNASGTYFSVDPWENGLQEPKTISPDEDKKRLDQARKLLTDARELKDEESGTKKPKTYLRIFDLAFIHDGAGWSVHRVPRISSLYWLNDGEHLLIKEASKLGLYEPATRTYVNLLTEEGIGSKDVTYRNKSNREL